MAGALESGKYRYALEFRSVIKRYGTQVALDQVSFAVEAGSIHCILGRNGSGKSTIIRSAIGHCRTDAGQIEVLGLDPRRDSQTEVEVLRRTAYMDAASLDHRLRCRELLAIASRGYRDWNHSRALSLAGAMELPMDRKVGALSKGMRAKLALLITLCRKAELCIYDEPFDGFDTPSRDEARRALRYRRDQHGHTIVLCSHQLDEVEALADSVTLLEAGRVRLHGAVTELTSMHHLMHVEWPSRLVPPVEAVYGFVGFPDIGNRNVVLARSEAFEHFSASGGRVLSHRTPTLAELCCSVLTAVRTPRTSWSGEGTDVA